MKNRMRKLMPPMTSHLSSIRIERNRSIHQQFRRISIHFVVKLKQITLSFKSNIDMGALGHSEFLCVCVCDCVWGLNEKMFKNGNNMCHCRQKCKKCCAREREKEAARERERVSSSLISICTLMFFTFIDDFDFHVILHSSTQLANFRTNYSLPATLALFSSFRFTKIATRVKCNLYLMNEKKIKTERKSSEIRKNKNQQQKTIKIYSL